MKRSIERRLFAASLGLGLAIAATACSGESQPEPTPTPCEGNVERGLYFDRYLVSYTEGGKVIDLSAKEHAIGAAAVAIQEYRAGVDAGSRDRSGDPITVTFEAQSPVTGRLGSDPAEAGALSAAMVKMAQDGAETMKEGRYEGPAVVPGTNITWARSAMPMGAMESYGEVQVGVVASVPCDAKTPSPSPS